MADETKPKPTYASAAKIGAKMARLARKAKDLADAGAAKDRELAELKAKPTNEALARQLSDAQGKLRETAHKDAFKAAAKELGLKASAIDDAWTLSGYKADSDAVDAKAVKTAIEGLKTGRDYLFEAAAEGSGTAETPASTKLESDPAGARGGAHSQGTKLRVKASDRTDAAWMKANGAELAQAAKEGRLEFLPA